MLLDRRTRLPLLVAVGLLAPLLCGADRAPLAPPPDVDAALAAARTCLAELTDTGDWTRDAPPAVDWLDRERWCLDAPAGPAGALPCETPPSDLVTLRVERQPEDHDRIQRLALNLSLRPPQGDWTVSYYGTAQRLEPGSPLGEHVYLLATVTVTRPLADGSTEMLSLTRASFELGDRVILAPGEYLPPDDLRARFDSPEALRDALLAQQDALHEQVSGLLDRGQASLCPEPDAPDRFVCGPLGDGEGHAMYDTCVRRGLTDDETAAARERLRSEVEARKALVRRGYPGIHAAVLQALAPEACWLLEPR